VDLPTLPDQSFSVDVIGAEFTFEILPDVILRQVRVVYYESNAFR
jgi:hypothetical protein